MAFPIRPGVFPGFGVGASRDGARRAADTGPRIADRCAPASTTHNEETHHMTARQPRRLRPSAIALAMAALLAGASHAAKPVAWEDIANDHKSTSDVLSYGLGLTAQRYSPAKAINTQNVAGLLPAWSYSFGGEKQRGQEGQVLVHDGVIYATASYSRFVAIDARTGKRLWSYEHRLPEDIRPCCDVVNRGPAIYGDKVYFGTLDAAIVALDRATGKVVWKEKFADHTIGYTMTGAPFVVKDQKTGKVMLGARLFG